MAFFLCDHCGHEQPAAESKIGRQVSCPSCCKAGVVTPHPPIPLEAPPVAPIADELSPEISAAPRAGAGWRLMRAAAGTAIVLLAFSVGLQTPILLRLAKLGGTVDVEVSNTSAIPVEVGNSVLPVAVRGTVPVQVNNSDLQVDLYNHYITSDDPIPVVIQNDPLPVAVQNEPVAVEVQNDPLPVEVKNEPLSVEPY